jgi:hypothetical protein
LVADTVKPQGFAFGSLAVFSLALHSHGAFHRGHREKPVAGINLRLRVPTGHREYRNLARPDEQSSAMFRMQEPQVAVIKNGVRYLAAKFKRGHRVLAEGEPVSLAEHHLGSAVFYFQLLAAEDGLRRQYRSPVKRGIAAENHHAEGRAMGAAGLRGVRRTGACDQR